MPVGVLGLADNHTLPKGTKLEFERTAPVFDAESSTLVISGGDITTAVRSLRDSPAIDDVIVLNHTEDEAIVRLHWNETVPALIECILEKDGTILSAFAGSDVWTFDIRFPSQDAVSRFYTECDDDTYSITVRKQRETTSASNGGLTAEQRDALSRAVAMGYFEVPRRTTLVELADELGISDVEASRRLRRGVSNVLQDHTTSRETGETTRHDG